MGLSELYETEVDEREQVLIDLGVGFDGPLMSIVKLDPESCDICSLLSEQQIANVVMAFDSLEPDDRLDAAERFATGEYTGLEAEKICAAYRDHAPEVASLDDLCAAKSEEAAAVEMADGVDMHDVGTQGVQR